MGEKKRKETAKRNWNKIIAIVLGVLFVVLMVVSSMGSSWINSLAVAKPGDIVTLDYTLYDASGSPIVTTDQQIFKNVVSQGGGMMYSKQLTVAANQSYGSPIYSVDVYTVTSGWGNQFAIFSREYDAVSSGIVGMKANEKKTITLPADQSMTQLWTADQLTRNNVNLSALQVGDVIAMGVSDNPTAMADNTSSFTSLRIAEITRKTDEGATVDFGYPRIDVSVASINSKH
jgi:FKBP-type peptidyl-prolyl cis-trans isomerase 2